MAKHQSGYNPGLSNELLTLWLKARDGLSCEEARDLIERLARTEQEVADGEEMLSGTVTQEAYDAGVAEAARAENAYAEGESAGRMQGRVDASRDIGAELLRLLNPPWGPRPTKAKLEDALNVLIRRLRKNA